MPELQQPQVQGIQPLPQRDFTAILDAFDASGCSIPDLVIALLTERRFKSSTYTAELLQQSGDVLRSLLRHAKLPRNAEKAACEALHRVYVREIKDLVKPSAGWNFSAQQATPEDIDDFDLEDLASDVADTAPLLWALLDILLSVQTSKLRVVYITARLNDSRTAVVTTVEHTRVTFKVEGYSFCIFELITEWLAATTDPPGIGIKQGENSRFNLLFFGFLSRVR
ncbi:hypothetical protein F5887DRAFT_1007168 [Amanita rubescens]|nr:hypothetical protein F5887DRAFT_1007168 [Amanita rubescens]